LAQAVRFSQVGGPEVLKLEEVAVAEPGAGEVRIRQSAIGLNFADLSLRAGVFSAPLPCCPGSEAAGIVVAVGAGVTQFQRGDRVAYGGSPPGAYVSEPVLALLNAESSVPRGEPR
jgi:NADPH2:quinone reductase